MKEQRKEPRVKVSFPVSCTVLPERKKYFYTVSKDLSLSGIRIISEKFLASGKDIKLSIDLINEVAELKAKIVWCNKEPYVERYYAGLKFLETNKETKEKLENFLQKTYSS